MFGKPEAERGGLRPLYDALVREARQPEWYRQGRVPDTIDGRFDMVSSVLALALLRLERDGEAGRRDTVLLTEIFIDDMDGTLRQIGIGDVVVGKHVGKIMGALGGRLGAFRDSFDGKVALADAVRRNVFRDAAPSEAAIDFVTARLTALEQSLAALPRDQLLRGEIGR